MASPRLKEQVIWLCVASILLTSVSLFFCFWWFSQVYKERNLEDLTGNSERVFARYIEEKQRLLATSLAILTADYGFKRAVATNDQATIASALDNLGGRLEADLMLITNTSGELISSSKSQFTALEELAFAEKNMILRPGMARFVILENTLYQLILQPVKSPRTVAYTIAGFEMNKTVANELKQLTGLEVSFTSRGGSVFSSTLPTTSLQTLKQMLSETYRQEWNASRPIYRNNILPLVQAGEGNAQVVLSADLRPSYLDFDAFMYSVIWVTLAVVLIGLVISLWFGNRLTVPLVKLVSTAREFAQGNYSNKQILLSSNYEVNTLANAFNEMGSEIQARERQIAFQANHDPLTKLFNRNAFLQAVSKLMDGNLTGYMIAVNLRGFRSLNNNLGAQMGDQCLVEIADRLGGFSGGNISLHGRLGGDEFISFIVPSAEAKIEQTLVELQDLLSLPLNVARLPIKVGHCVGVSEYPAQAAEAEILLRRAVIAMDSARAEKVAIRYYQQGEDEAHLKRIQLMDELREALINDNGQLFMVYQPKLNLRSCKIEKLESLIRWRKENGQWVSPELFIGLAEQAGLIVEITQWVFKTVLAQIQIWQSQGIFLKVAVNISSQDVLHSHFREFVLAQLALSGVQAKYITLELTERDLMANEEDGLQRLLELKQAGFELSVDDYGIGQSSLGKLKHLPVDELKIDKSFVLKLDTTEADQVIVQSTIQLGHNLGLSVVAEGVENQATLTMLSGMGCDHIQGYFLSKPINAAEIPTWLKNYEKAEKLA